MLDDDSIVTVALIDNQYWSSTSSVRHWNGRRHGASSTLKWSADLKRCEIAPWAVAPNLVFRGRAAEGVVAKSQRCVRAVAANKVSKSRWPSGGGVSFAV